MASRDSRRSTRLHLDPEAAEMTKGPPTSTSRPSDVTLVMNDTGPSPFFAALPHPCIIVNANRRTENGVGLGTRLSGRYVCCSTTSPSSREPQRRRDPLVRFFDLPRREGIKKKQQHFH